MDQDEFNYYMRHLSYDEDCKLMVKSAVNLCSFKGNCPYQGSEYYTYKGERLRECKRTEILKYKKILGVKPEKKLDKF